MIGANAKRKQKIKNLCKSGMINHTRPVSWSGKQCGTYRMDREWLAFCPLEDNPCQGTMRREGRYLRGMNYWNQELELEIAMRRTTD